MCIHLWCSDIHVRVCTHLLLPFLRLSSFFVLVYPPSVSDMSLGTRVVRKNTRFKLSRPIVVFWSDCFPWTISCDFGSYWVWTLCVSKRSRVWRCLSLCLGCIQFGLSIVKAHSFAFGLLYVSMFTLDFYNANYWLTASHLWKVSWCLREVSSLYVVGVWFRFRLRMACMCHVFAVRLGSFIPLLIFDLGFY